MLGTQSFGEKRAAIGRIFVSNEDRSMDEVRERYLYVG